MLETPLFTLDVPEQGAVNGHVHLDLPSAAPEDIAVTGVLANVISSLLFERMKAQGTNILFQLGDRSAIDILARREDDGLNLQWSPKQIEAGQLNDVQQRLHDRLFVLDQKPAEVHTEEEPPPDVDDEENEFWVRQLTRVP